MKNYMKLPWYITTCNSEYTLCFIDGMIGKEIPCLGFSDDCGHSPDLDFLVHLVELHNKSLQEKEEN